MNRNIASTVITDTVRVSSAVIQSFGPLGSYHQYETIVFGLPGGMQMEVHGTSSHDDDEHLTSVANLYHEAKCVLLCAELL